MLRISRATIIGAGTMGAGIAEVCAKAGIDTTLTDQTEEILEIARKRITTSLEKAVKKEKISEADKTAALGRIRYDLHIDSTDQADLIVESVPEEIELKKRILSEASSKAPAHAIVASNTSSLPLTELAAATEHSDRVIGTHFFNPPAVMPLLEIVRAEQTTQETVDAVLALAERLGKKPIVVRDVPGFATSRLGLVIGLEAMRMYESGVASVEDIDRAMELGYRHPMGPLKLTDLVGLDVRLAIADHLAHEVGDQFRAPPILRRLVRAGKLGQKTGAGFYRWVDGKPVA